MWRLFDKLVTSIVASYAFIYVQFEVVLPLIFVFFNKEMFDSIYQRNETFERKNTRKFSIGYKL